jgi:hypothetical protein
MGYLIGLICPEFITIVFFLQTICESLTDPMHPDWTDGDLNDVLLVGEGLSMAHHHQLHHFQSGRVQVTWSRRCFFKSGIFFGRSSHLWHFNG